jgi:hypothetical protein
MAIHDDSTGKTSFKRSEMIETPKSGMADAIAACYASMLGGALSGVSEASASLAEAYSHPETFAHLFSLLAANRTGPVRVLACAGLKSIVVNLWTGLPADIRHSVRMSLLSVLRIERDSVARALLCEVVHAVLAEGWPELPALLVELAGARDSRSLALALRLVRIVAPQAAGAHDFGEYAARLFDASFDCPDVEIRLLATETLASGSFPISTTAIAAVVDLFGVLLDSGDRQQCFDAANALAALVQTDVDLPALELMRIFVSFLSSSTIDDEMKRTVLLAVDGLVSARAQELCGFVKVLFGQAVAIAAALFDDECALENRASSVSFRFLKGFMKVTDFSEILLRLVRVDSPGTLFGSLCALSAVVKWFQPQLSALIGLLGRAIATGVHSIQEICFSIMSHIVERFDGDGRVLTEAIVVHVLRFIVSDHPAVHELSLKCVIRFLFLVRVEPKYCGSIFEWLNSSLSIGARTDRSLALVGLSALVYRFRETTAEYLASVLLDIWLLACSPDPADPRAQPLALETIGYCVRFVPSICGDCIGNAVQLFVNILESADPQLFGSVCSALKSLSKAGRPELLPVIGRIFAPVIAVLAMPRVDKESIDENGLRCSDLHSIALKLARQLISQANGIDGLDSFLLALVRFAPDAVFWECESVFLSTLEICCFHNLRFLQSVFLIVHQDPNVWAFLAEVIKTRLTMDDDDKQLLCTLCFEWAQTGEYVGFRPLCSLLHRFSRVFSVDSVLSVFEDAPSPLTPENICEFIDIFQVFVELNLLSSCSADARARVIHISLGLMSHCLSCTVPPSPIRFLNALIIRGFEFDTDSLTAFLGLFAQIVQSAGHAAIYWEATVIEVFRVVLSVISHCPGFVFDWQVFLNALPLLVSIRAPLPITDLVDSLARLSLTPPYAVIPH